MANTDKKNIDAIAGIILQEHMDIVALQEVFRVEAVDELRQALGPLEWDRAWKKPTNNESDNANDGYAFIWRKRRLKKVETLLPDGKIRKFEPRIYNQYKKLGGGELMRPPYYGRFTPSGLPGGNQMELRLLNIHLRWSGKDSDRQREALILSQELLPIIQDRVYGTNYNTYTMILGDYNLNINNGINSSPFLYSFIMLSRNGKTIEIVTEQDQKTTLKADQSLPYESTEERFANNYDHFTFDNRLRDKCTILQCRRVDGYKYIANDFERYKKEISTHMPIVIEIDIREGGM